MTCIEFFDRTLSENVCTCIASSPERVILVGHKGKLLKKHAVRYATVFPNVEFDYRSITRNSLPDIIAALSELVEHYEDCVFDLTGGEELYLVDVGVIYERYRDRGIQMHRFNLRNGTMTDRDGLPLRAVHPIELSVEENIRIYGGDVVYDSEKSGGTHLWQYNNAFKKEIDALWEVCRADVKAWNVSMGILAFAERHREEGDHALTSIVHFGDSVDRSKIKAFADDRSICGRLCDFDLIDCSYDDEKFQIIYRNEQVKRCLIKAGQVLEMKIYSIAKQLREADGSPYYNDVMNGVCIDWDGEIHARSKEPDTANEIDVMLMRGICPVFISCKNGNVDAQELYKLNTVAEKFGKQYAKKVLIATALEKNSLSADYFRQRAADMKIRLIEDVQTMDDDTLSRVLRQMCEPIQ